MKILGLSFFYHDAAACLVIDGVPVAMSEEERFSRIKHDSEFPKLAVKFVLEQAGLKPEDLDVVVFYEKPFFKLDRIMRSALTTFPLAPRVFVESIKSLFTKKIWVRQIISEELGVPAEKIFFSGHHYSHMASSFFCSPYEKAAILTIDGVGEWATTSLGVGDGTKIDVLKEIRYPHSLGLLYSASTEFLGFEVNEGEYKVMGMAPYGTPKYVDRVRKLLRVNPDASFELNLEYFAYHLSHNRSCSKKFFELFGPPRDRASHFFTRTSGWPSYFGEKPGPGEYEKLAEQQEYYADVAASVQAVLEECVVGLANQLHKETGLTRLCLAGGVALNSVANWKIVAQTPFKEIFVQPAAGDAGGALGAAMALEMVQPNAKRSYTMMHASYGKAFTSAEIEETLKAEGMAFTRASSETDLIEQVTTALEGGKVIGWFHGRFEWGPRALGNRSILADPRRTEMKDIVNTTIKFREPYRPFAPSVLAENAEEYFEMPNAMNHHPARFMLFVAQVRADKHSVIPAVTHVDGTARPQLVFAEDTPRYYKLIKRFGEKTGVPVLLDTSFNLKGEPIVTSPKDALNTFMKSGMDLLVLEDYLVWHP